MSQRSHSFLASSDAISTVALHPLPLWQANPPCRFAPHGHRPSQTQQYASVCDRAPRSCPIEKATTYASPRAPGGNPFHRRHCPSPSSSPPAAILLITSASLLVAGILALHYSHVSTLCLGLA